MIYVTRLNGSSFIINAEQIEMIEATPDTVIILTTGKKVIVSETPDELVQKVIDFKKRCYPIINEVDK